MARASARNKLSEASYNEPVRARDESIVRYTALFDPASEPSVNWKVIVGLAVLYIAAGKLSLLFAWIQPNTSALWPPAGLALGACLLFGYGVWPAIFVGAFLVNVTTAGSVGTSLGIATGNTL